MSVVSEIISRPSATVDDLPNLQIEIENDLDQRMETDEADSSKAGTASSDTEEGELVDDEDDRLGQLAHTKTNAATVHDLQNVPTGRSILKYEAKEYEKLQHQKSVQNPNGAFVTGVNVFSPEEQAKLDKRAQRFGIEASEAKILTEKLLKKLYKSMGVKPTNTDIRVEALHMRGTQNMNTKDVFDYFKDYGPASLEWITDNSCNVVWLDDISAARALLGLSVHISGQTDDSKEQPQSDSDVDMESQAVREDDSDCLSEESDAVDVEKLGVQLPSGRWRRGAPHPLSPCIFLRFATTSDRSLPRPGFAKFGSHQSGGYTGLISETRRRRLQGALPPPFVFEDVGDEVIPKPSIEETDNVNPWGILAKTWSQFDRARQPKPPSPKIERTIPMPSRMTPPPSPPIFAYRPRPIPRTRRRREGDTQAAHVVMRKISNSEEDSSDNEEWRSRSKMPRMRMHADDEEKKLRKKLKKKSRHKRSLSYSPTRNNLRRRLGEESDKSGEPVPIVEIPEEDDEVPDLRVAVAADRSPSPEDSKADLRQSLFHCGNVKSVLRGARGQSEEDDDDEEEDEKEEEEEEEEDQESDRTEKVRSSTRRHRSRSKERRRYHRKHRKEGSSHKSRRKVSDSDSDERTSKTVKSTIRKKSPEIRERQVLETTHSRDRRSSHADRDKRSLHHERRRRNEDHHDKSEKRRHARNSGERHNKDLRLKIAHKHSSFDLNNEFRSKSPLQIEIDNDEYFKRVEGN